MNPQFLVFLLLAAGLILIFAEFFIPSGGVIAVVCAGCVIASLYYAWQTWHATQPAYWWIYLASVAFLIPATIIGGFQLLNHTALGNRVLLSAPTDEEVRPYQQEEQRLLELVGREGVSLNLMTPGGLVKVGDDRLHAVSEGMIIESGTPVQIVAVWGTRVVVRPVELPQHPSDATVEFESVETHEQTDPWNPDVQS